ncbi:MAG: LemA family protein [Candidatus Paraimprobicoccus trichonymphae]|uniref:LemA family protein n=1 Tax=Candidatus Paraimprobicoccus trichonymphae TaxID=3033793 RepID=A0AA48KXM4_9FIRM|nr:MAG: LemA family protein [Candidatus Paraimprobicoccus trichonymphae]
MKNLSTGKIVLFGVLGAVLIFIISLFSSYNKIVSLKENVNGKSADISTQLQRRADLVPNLVSTVKGYASRETEIMTQISDARAKLAGAGSLTEKGQANTELSGALSRLLVVVENYPNLKSDSQFTHLMDELAGTENRISVSRRDYNNSVKEYNQKIKEFPTVILANMSGFSEAEYFQADEGSKKAPSVSFS